MAKLSKKEAGQQQQQAKNRYWHNKIQSLGILEPKQKIELNDEEELEKLADNVLQKDIIVDIVDGVPFCNVCRPNYCLHVGFVICAEQMNMCSRLE